MVGVALSKPAGLALFSVPRGDPPGHRAHGIRQAVRQCPCAPNVSAVETIGNEAPAKLAPQTPRTSASMNDVARPLLLLKHRLSRFRRYGTSLFAASCAMVAGCVSSSGCEARYDASPQFKGCGFQNLPNPEVLPSASAWRIWSRFIVGSKVDTVPVDPIPVHTLSTAELDALDPKA